MIKVALCDDHAMVGRVSATRCPKLDITVVERPPATQMSGSLPERRRDVLVLDLNFLDAADWRFLPSLAMKKLPRAGADGVDVCRRPVCHTLFTRAGADGYLSKDWRSLWSSLLQYEPATSGRKYITPVVSGDVGQ